MMFFTLERVLILLLLLAVIDGRRRKHTTTTKRTTTTSTSTTTTTTSTTTTTTSGSATYSLFEQQALAQTNALRATHCSVPMSFNSALRDMAQNYSLWICATKNFTHSGNRFQNAWTGENLWSESSTGSISLNGTNGSVPVNSWYSEIANYNFSAPGFALNTGHFTQLIWNASIFLGIGYCCSSDNHNCYVVANYFPGGNIGGGYAANVGPKCQ